MRAGTGKGRPTVLRSQIMPMADRFQFFGPLDAVALLLLMASSSLCGLVIEREGAKRPSVTVLMMRYRREWMVQLVTRQPRIFDAAILDSLRQGTAFLSSTTFIAIGGVLALIGNADRLSGVAAGLGEVQIPTAIYQIKLALFALFLINGFLKLVWANRLFGYCAVVMASVPNDPEDPRAMPRARQAGELNIRAAWNFNRGLRSIIFALAAVTWIVGPLALIVATGFALWVVLWREYHSRPHDILSEH